MKDANHTHHPLPDSGDIMFNDRFACVAHFSNLFIGSPYYSAGRAWSDYAPAYAFGYDTYAIFQKRSFEDAEAELHALWDAAHGPSRLTWPEARGAVNETWSLLDTETPGPLDRPQHGAGA